MSTKQSLQNANFGLTEAMISELRESWRELCNKNYEVMGDYGSCVLGAGLTIRGKMIVTAHGVCVWQGSMVWETGLQDLLNRFNAKYGTNVVYEPGRMD